MNQDRSEFSKRFNLANLAVGIVGLAFSAGAYAQVAAVNTKLTAVQTLLLSLGGIIMTIAFVVGGWRMAFDKQTLRDVSSIFIGGVIVGSASALGTWLVS